MLFNLFNLSNPRQRRSEPARGAKGESMAEVQLNIAREDIDG
jgi:hypothetical protein